ncbi:hypothetical protein Tco_1155094 [Tanacetum coccineum]
MPWMHPNLVITDLEPPVGSYNQSDVRRLSAFVLKLRDIHEGVLVLSVMGIYDFLCFPEWTGSEVQEELHHDVRPTLQKLPFYYTPPAAADVVVLDPTPDDLAATTLSTKVLFDDDNDDEESDYGHNACVEIPLVTPICSSATIPLGGNQSRGSIPSATEGSRGKAVMDDVVDIPSRSEGRPRASTGPTLFT